MSLQEIMAVHPDGSVDLANRRGGTQSVLESADRRSLHQEPCPLPVTMSSVQDRKTPIDASLSDYAFVTRVSRHRTEDVGSLVSRP